MSLIKSTSSNSDQNIIDNAEMAYGDEHEQQSDGESDSGEISDTDEAKKTTKINIEVPNFNEPLSTQYVFDQFKMLAGMINGLDQKIGQLVTRDVLDKQVNELKTHMDDENASLKLRMSKIEEENKTLKERLAAVERRSDEHTLAIDRNTYKSTKALEVNDEIEHHGRANSIRVYGLKDT